MEVVIGMLSLFLKMSLIEKLREFKINKMKHQSISIPLDA